MPRRGCLAKPWRKGVVRSPHRVPCCLRNPHWVLRRFVLVRNPQRVPRLPVRNPQRVRASGSEPSEGSAPPVRNPRRVSRLRRCSRDPTSPVRQVLPARAHQRRRHGRGLQGQGLRRRGLRAARRGQAHPAEHRGGRRVHHDVHRRGEDRGAAEAREHRPDLRPRQGRRQLLHRARVRARQGPARDLRSLPQGRRARCRSRRPAS